MLLGARTGAWAGGGAPLPYDAEIEYIESSSNGLQYIDTGIKPTNKHSFISEFCGFDVAGQEGGIGCRNSWNNAMWGINYGNYTGTPYFTYFQCEFGNKYAYERNVPFYSTKSIISFGATTKVNNVEFSTLPDVPFSCDCTATIFLRKTLSGFSGAFNGKIWYFKMYFDGVLIMDLVPVRVGQVGYMYDRANPTGGPLGNGLYPNAGTGSFILGPDVN